MSISYEETGRTRQKARTRAALVDAARAVLEKGHTPSVEDVAEGAGISRATAYRYFPNRRALLVAAHPQIEATSLLGDAPPTDPRGRLERTLEGLIGMTVESEPALRTMLRLSLEPDSGEDLLLRKGRAIGWIEQALEPLQEQLGPMALHRLALAIRSACGIEALVWLTDIAGLSRQEAAELMRWSGLALFSSALAEARATGG